MNDLSAMVGQPVRSLQNYLRLIANETGEIPSVVPDGIYGGQTMDAVAAYQEKEGLPVTGETDRETWNRILSEYRDILDEKSQPEYTRIYPAPDVIFDVGESSVLLFPLQAVMHVITQHFPHLGKVSINGVNDKETFGTVKNLQKVFGLSDTGKIDKTFWNMVSSLYDSQVSGRKEFMET